MLSTPFYGDQFVNSAALKKRGMADTLFYEDLNDDDKIYDALLNLLQPVFVLIIQMSAVKSTANCFF